MRKLVVVVLSLILVALPGFGKTTIVHWMHHSPARARLVLEFAEQFMAENPDIEVVVRTIPYTEYKTKLLTALAAGSGPDVAQIPSYAVSEFRQYGVIQPFPEDIISPDYLRSNCVSATIEPLIIEGKVYGLPTDVQTVVLFYNPALFEKAGLDPERPPQDWNELIEYAKKLTLWEDGRMVQSGFATDGYEPVVEMFMRQAGATFWDEEGKYVKFEEAQVEGLKFLTDTRTVHQVYTPKMGSRWTAFRQGKLGMVFGHGAMVGSFKVGAAPGLVFRTALPPAHPETGSRTTVLTSWAMVITNNCTHPQMAAKWLAYITSPDAQRRWFEGTGELPAYVSLIDDPQLRQDPLNGPILESLKYAVPTFSKGWGNPAAYLREPAFREEVDKNVDPEVALKKAIDMINAYLKETFGAP